LSTSQCQTQKGSDSINNSLCLHGNKSKTYCQSGNKALGGEDEDSFGLDGQLLDKDALDVTSDPSKRVEEEVDKVIRGAISKLISDAVSHCLDVSLKGTVKI
jgi:hypothetical protein